MSPQTETPEDQIISIMNQVNDMKLGKRFQVTCPFCGGHNQRGVALLAPDEWVRPGVSPVCCDEIEVVFRALSGLDDDSSV